MPGILLEKWYILTFWGQTVRNVLSELPRIGAVLGGESMVSPKIQFSYPCSVDIE